MTVILNLIFRTKIFNFALKIKGLVGRVALAKFSNLANPRKKYLERALGISLVRHEIFLAMNNKVCYIMENLFLSITVNIFSL